MSLSAIYFMCVYELMDNFLLDKNLLVAIGVDFLTRAQSGPTI